MRDPGRNTWTFYEAAADGSDLLPPAPFDALTDPGVEDLLPAGLSLWPRGAAWGTPDGQAAGTDTVLAGFTRALLSPFADLYRRAWLLTRESRALTLVDSLPDWEADYGLPDACSPDPAEAARRRALLTRVRAVATITPQDFIQLARQEGFDIAIEEPAQFECGFSECGGAHTVGDRLQEVYWIVHVYGLAVDYFRCGESECGHDPLFAVAEVERLQCLFARLAPGWTQPVYSIYEAQPETDALVARMAVPPSAERKKLIDDLILELKSWGIWPKLDLFYVMAAHDAQAARLNWASASFDLTPNGAPAFLADRGYSGGTNAYLATGYNPAVHGVHYTRDSAHIGAWNLTDRAAGNIIPGGVSMTTSLQCAVVPRSAGDVVWINVNDSGAALGSVTRADGLTLGTRLDGSSRSNFRNNLLLGTAAAASIAVPSVPLDLLCWNVNGGASRIYWCTDRISVWTMGGGLTASEVTALHSALHAYLTALGALPT